MITPVWWLMASDVKICHTWNKYRQEMIVLLSYRSAVLNWFLRVQCIVMNWVFEKSNRKWKDIKCHDVLPSNLIYWKLIKGTESPLSLQLSMVKRCCVRCHSVIIIYFTAIVINTHLRPICGAGHRRCIYHGQSMRVLCLLGMKVLHLKKCKFTLFILYHQKYTLYLWIN